MNQINLITTQKGKKKIIYNNYIYNFDKICKSFISWRCVRRCCTGRIHTDLLSKTVIKSKEHWHEIEDNRLVQIELNMKLKSSALTLSEEFGIAIRNSTINFTENQKRNIKKYDHLRDYFDRLKNNIITHNNRSESQLLDSQKFTFDNKIFLQFESDITDKDGILIFSSPDSLKIIEKCEIWMADGTFYSSPKGFSQVFIIHGIYFGVSLPLIYIIMKHKSQIAYINMWKEIIKLINYEPKYFIVDFEIGIYNSIMQVFNGIEIYGCNFHFSQIVVRFLKESKIITFYKNETDFRKYVKYTLLLSYIPIEKIDYEFAKIQKLKKDLWHYDLFYDFFIKNFLNSQIKNKKREFWSVHFRILNNIPTTTNSCEAYHRHLNSRTSKKNTILGKIVDLL
ncbi:hypothetical protein DMUE_5537 [Dictyocoela muelleri]|nr:hypothetical protein DMUE_5537 [Dictyocoela muelleri]